MSLLLCAALLPTTVFATGAPYGITSQQRITATAVNEGDESLKAIKEEACYRALGPSMTNETAGQGGETGVLRSTFKIESNESVVTFTMDKPQIDTNADYGAASAMLGGERYMILVQDAQVATSPVYVFEAKTDGDSLEITVPMLNHEEIICAVSQYNTMYYIDPDDSYNPCGAYYEENSVDVPTAILENTLASDYHYEWTFEPVSNSDQFSSLQYKKMDAEIRLNVGNLNLDPSSFVLDTDTFIIGDVREQATGYWIVSLAPPEGVSDSEYVSDHEITDPIKISFDATLPQKDFVADKEIYVIAQLIIINNHYNSTFQGTESCFTEAAPLVTSTMTPAVTITPADMTIYMGGDGGYEGVVGDGSEVGTTSNSMPEPLFYVSAPSGVAVDPGGISFSYNNDTISKTWSLEEAGKDAEGIPLYRMKAGAGQTAVRVQFTDKNGDVHVSDEFKPTEVGDLYTTYAIDIYPGQNDTTKVVAQVNNSSYPISTNSGTLTVRAVADDDPTSDIVTDAPTEKIASGKAVAVEPSGTTYTLNNTGVKLPADSKPSLLFDSIIEDSPESTDRTDALKDKVNETLGAVATNATRHYEIKYLDLVDANNGNAWITSSQGTDIYWGYPDGTDQSTQFKILHFKDLHRDGNTSGYDVSDTETCSVDSVKVENTANGIKFHVAAGGFSPFALVYDTVNTYTITATAGENGSISPSGEFTVTAGADQTFTITPDRGYHIQDVLVDGVSVGAVSSYTFAAVEEDHTITATFAKDAGPVTRYRIEASAGEGGTISPEGIVRVSQGGSQTFIITPDEGYKIEDVLVDGESVGPVSEYTFKNVRAWHTITVTFAKLPADPGDTGVSDWLDTEHHMAYLNGYPGQVFGPDRDMTRAEAAQMFYNLLLDKDVAGTASFTDVAADAWYAKAVNTLASLGMIQGVEGNRFQPDRAITRAEFTAIAMRFTNGETTGENLFSDVNPDQWFYDMVVGAVQYGWINGYEDGTFRPESTIKRAEVAAITNRMLARAADEAYVDAHASQLRLFADVAKDHWAYYTIVEASNTHDYQTNHGNETWKDA